MYIHSLELEVVFFHPNLHIIVCLKPKHMSPLHNIEVKGMLNHSLTAADIAGESEYFPLFQPTVAATTIFFWCVTVPMCVCVCVCVCIWDKENGVGSDICWLSPTGGYNYALLHGLMYLCMQYDVQFPLVQNHMLQKDLRILSSTDLSPSLLPSPIQF